MWRGKVQKARVGLLILLLVGLLLGGCVQGGSGNALAHEQRDRMAAEAAAWSAGEDVAGSGLEAAWLEVFDDPQLSGLVAEAMARNRSLRVAAARMEQSLELARVEGANRLPELSLTGGAQRAAVNNGAEPVARTVSNRFNGGLTAQWELDLWGRVRAQARAAEADAMAAAEDYAAARLSLATRVAQAWYDLVERRLQTQLAEETLRSFEENLRTVEERFRRGLNPALDLRLTRANVANVEATLLRQRRLEDAAERQLEVLLGRYPRALVGNRGGLPSLTEPVRAGLPAQVLERRPDVVAAQNRLVAADERLRGSRRALLPAIRLTASYGRSSQDLDNLLESGFDVWSLAGNLAMPLFAGGRLRANVRRSEARLAEAVASYEEVVLTAFREVETALRAESLLRGQLAALRRSAEESVGAEELARERYERGLVDILTVLESQRAAFNSRSAVIALENELLQNRLFLYRALGGSDRPMRMEN